MKKQFNDSCVISIVMEREHADWVRHMAIKMSNQEGKQITLSDAVRMALETAYPLPKQKQMSMF